MEDGSMVKLPCMRNPCGRRRYEKPMKRWIDNAENDLKTCGCQKIEAEGFHEEWVAIIKRLRPCMDCG
jgi:hypothetical protein